MAGRLQVNPTYRLQS